MILHGRSIEDMSGVKGQKSDLNKELPRRYRLDLLDEVDGRCRESRRYRDGIQRLGDEVGGLDGLSLTELETLRRFFHLSRRLSKAERCELLGDRVDESMMNDGLRSWLGLLRQVQAIKARHQVGKQHDPLAFLDEEEETEQ